MLVGHEPDLSRFLAAALGSGKARVTFKKGGAACIEFEKRIVPGAATLHWFAPPRMLRAIRRA